MSLRQKKVSASGEKRMKNLRRSFMEQNKTLYVPAETEILKFGSETDVIRTSTVGTEINGWTNPWVTWTDYDEGGTK